jgi:hypothetical protein
MNKYQVAQSDKGFEFTFYIEKAIADETSDSLIVTGIASTMNLDHDNERMSESALRSMAKIINEKGVPLRVEHNNGDEAIIGTVNKGWIDNRSQLCISAELIKENPVARLLHTALKFGTKLGLSVGGHVKRAYREMSDAVGKMVKTFYDVELNEVSVTQRPANYDAWLVAKSYKEQGEDINTFEKSTQLRQEFLFDNPQLDYMQAFAKSIPDKEWKKVGENDNIINDMNIFKKNETSETTEAKKDVAETTTEKEVATSSETAEKEVTTSETAEKDQEETTTEKAETETISETKKESTEHTTEKEATETVSEKKEQSADGGETSEVAEKDTTEETMSERIDRLEESQKSIIKMIKQGFQKISKAMEDSTTEVKEATASETDTEKEESEASTKKEATDETTTEKEVAETTTEKEEDETTEKENSEAKPSDYQMDEVSKAIGTIASSLKTQSDLDTFVAALSTAIQKSQDDMQKSGKSIIGFTQRIVDMIKDSPEFQEEIKKMVKQPGMRKSVLVGGVPYMVSKDGKRFALSAKEVVAEEVKKSDKPASFKELFKSNFSSFGEKSGE